MKMNEAFCFLVGVVFCMLCTTAGVYGQKIEIDGVGNNGQSIQVDWSNTAISDGYAVEATGDLDGGGMEAGRISR